MHLTYVGPASLFTTDRSSLVAFRATLRCVAPRFCCGKFQRWNFSQQCQSQALKLTTAQNTVDKTYISYWYACRFSCSFRGVVHFMQQHKTELDPFAWYSRFVEAVITCGSIRFWMDILYCSEFDVSWLVVNVSAV